MAGTPFPSKGGAATAKKTAATSADEKAGFDTAAEDGDVKRGPSAPAGDPFSTPAGASEIKINDLVGLLLLVKPTEVIDEMTTEIGVAKDVIRADVIILDGDDAGSEYEDVLVFQIALKRALKKVLDGANPYLLGRLEMGAKKPGKSAPYIFAQPDEDDIAAARAHLAI